jgi:hypothetical protein
LSRFKQLKEEENRRKAVKALAAGDLKASASSSEDEESDDDTTEEVLFLFCFIHPSSWTIVKSISSSYLRIPASRASTKPVFSY